jgi:hypothetical protein
MTAALALIALAAHGGPAHQGLSGPVFGFNAAAFFFAIATIAAARRPRRPRRPCRPRRPRRPTLSP